MKRRWLTPNRRIKEAWSCCLRKGERKVLPCKNIATNPRINSLLDSDWAVAEDQGEVIAVFHSHPYLPPEQVRRIALPAKITWHICNPNTEKWCSLGHQASNAFDWAAMGLGRQ